MHYPHATPVSVVRTTDLERLYDQLADQQDALARQADTIARLCQELASHATRMAAPIFSPAPTTAASRGNAAALGPS